MRLTYNQTVEEVPLLNWSGLPIETMDRYRLCLTRALRLLDESFHVNPAKGCFVWISQQLPDDWLGCYYGEGAPFQPAVLIAYDESCSDIEIVVGSSTKSVIISITSV